MQDNRRGIWQGALVERFASFAELNAWLGDACRAAWQSQLAERLRATWGATKAGKLKIHVVRYADDFVVTSTSKEVLEHEIRPWGEAFLAKRVWQRSADKTRVVHVDEGFDFLGWNFRKFSNGKLLIRPSKKNAQAFYRKVNEVISTNKRPDRRISFAC